MELPVLVALFGIATAVGLSNRSWLAGLAVLVLVPAGLFAMFWIISATSTGLLLARASHAMRHPARRLEAATRLRDAAYSLTDQRWSKARAETLLRTALDDAAPAVRFVAACGLVRIGSGESGVVGTLIGGLRDRELRPDALNALQSLRAGAKPAVPALIDLLADMRQPGWWQVPNTLRAIGPDAREAVPALLASLELAASDEIEWPIRALAAIGDAAALPALQRLAERGKDERVRACAREAMQKF